MDKTEIRIPRVANNGEVASAWRAGQPARSGHMWTNGQEIYSYWLRIGFTSKQPGAMGLKILLDLTSRGGRGYSMTTSHHVALCRSDADVIVPGKNVCQEGTHGYGWGQPMAIWIGAEVFDIETGKVIDHRLYSSYQGCRERSFYDRRTGIRVQVAA